MRDHSIHVLLVEDNPADVLLIHDALMGQPAATFVIATVAFLADARPQLSQAVYDIVLLDLGLPDSQGQETFVTLHAHAPQMPIIVLTGLADESLGLQALQAGAQDYLVKGHITGDGLARAIRSAIVRKRAETDNAQVEIAERQRVEATLRESQERLANIVGSAMDAIISIDVAQRIVVFNTAAEQMFGCPAAVALSQPIDQFIPVAFRSIHARHIQAFGQTGITSRSMHARGHLTALHADGTEFPIEATISQTVAAGQPLYTVIIRDMSARLQAGAALRASEARYRQIVETAQEGIWQIDAVNSTTFVNAKMAELLGYTVNEMIGAPLFAFMDAEGQKIAVTNVERRRQGITEQHDFKFRHKNGTAVWTRISTNPVLDSAGNYAGALAMVTDITDRKQAEEQLRQSELRFATAFRANPAALVIFRRGDGRFLDANDTYQQMVGYDRAELIGRNARDLNIFPDPDARAEMLRQLEKHAAIRDYEISIRTKSGELRTILLSGETVEFGGEACIIAIGIDITDRKQAEGQLRYQANLLAQVSDAIISTDSNFTITSWNAAAEALYGWPAQDVIGKPLGEIVPTQYLESDRQQIHAHFLREAHWRGEVTQQRRDGTQRSILSSVSLLKDSTGAPIGAVAVNRDITNRKRAEQVLRQSEDRFAKAFRANPAAMSITRIDDGCFIDINASHERLFGYTRDELIGQSAGSIGIYVNPDQRANVVQIIREQGSLHDAELTLRTKSGELREVLCSLEVIDLEGQPSLLGTTVDITERKRADQAFARAAERLRVLADASRTFAEVGADYQALLDRIAQMTGLQLGEGCSIRLLSDDAMSLQLVALYDRDPQKLELTRRSISDVLLLANAASFICRVFQTDQSLLLPVLEQAQLHVLAKPQYWPLVDRIGMHSLMIVPMRVRGQAIGVLSVSRHRPEQPPFDTDDLMLAQDLADRAALAIGNAQLLAQVQRELAERQQTEAQLRESEERLRAVTNTAQVGLVIVDREHRYRYANPAYAAIFHLPTAEIVGQRVAEVLTPVYEAQIRPRLERAFGGERVSYELIVGAEERYYAVTYEPGVYQSSNVVVVVVVDITERKRAEEALRAAEAQYRTLVEQIPAIIYTAAIDEQSSTYYVSPQIESILGFTPQEWLAEPQFWLTQIHPDDHTRVLEAVGHTHASDTPIPVEYRSYTRDGRMVWLRDTARVVRNKAEQPLFMQGIILDITEYKQAEATLDQRVRLAALAADVSVELTKRHTLAEMLQACASGLVQHLDAAFARIWTLNEHDQVLELQASAGMYTHLDGARGRIPVGMFKIGRIAYERRPHLTNTVLSDPSIDDPEWARREGLVAFAGYPLIVEDRLAGVMALFARQPLTQLALDALTPIADTIALGIEHKQVETMLIDERALLARRVDERTADLSAANAELARAAILKDEFLASMSHELRTPLAAVLGLSEALQEEVYGPLNDRQRRSLHSIEESGQHLLDLINDILDLAKIGAGQFALVWEPASIMTIAQSSLRMIKQLADQKQLTVTTAIDPIVTMLTIDARRVKQILVNLLSNAVKFTPVGGSIGLECVGDAMRQTVDLTVWDTGIGIAHEDMNHLFQPFVQLDSRLARQYEGTGLGLALVYRMVELHGGSITVTSDVGHGSRFTVSLPWNTSSVDTPTSPSTHIPMLPREAQLHARNTTNSTRHATQPPLVLLAEDNPAIINLISDYLGACGYQVAIAYNGAEAIAQVHEQQPAIVLMDIQMPNMDGIEAIRRIRASTDMADIPIIALTALAMPGDRERCLAAGANAYLSKPVNLRGLANLIETYLHPVGE